MRRLHNYRTVSLLVILGVDCGVALLLNTVASANPIRQNLFYLLTVLLQHNSLRYSNAVLWSKYKLNEYSSSLTRVIKFLIKNNYPINRKLRTKISAIRFYGARTVPEAKLRIIQVSRALRELARENPETPLLILYCVIAVLY